MGCIIGLLEAILENILLVGLAVCLIIAILWAVGVPILPDQALTGGLQW